MKQGLCKQSETALHTHDRICFKRCRRKWSLSSPFGRHLQPKASVKGANPNLWFGSGFHWAMEDYFGYNKFGGMVPAFEAYVESFEVEELPESIDTLLALGIEMLTYFQEWADKHKSWKIVWLNDAPLVEVPFSLVLEELCYYDYCGDRYFIDAEKDEWVGAAYKQCYTEEELKAFGAEYQEIVFHGKLDAIVEDTQGDWWVLDYKTAKAIDTKKLPLDPQISNYCWAAEQALDHKIAGMLYIQVSKNPPSPPKELLKGISTDKRQRTTHALYRQSLIDYYGSVQKAPAANVSFLNDLAYEETENGNAFVRYDWVTRTTEAKENTYKHIIAEGKEMLHPQLAIYHNPTKDCSWDCPFKDICLAMEEGVDWEIYLEEFEVRHETMNQEVERWQVRMFNKHPELFPEEYKKYCSIAVDSLEEFISKYSEEE